MYPKALPVFVVEDPHGLFHHNLLLTNKYCSHGVGHDHIRKDHMLKIGGRHKRTRVENYWVRTKYPCKFACWWMMELNGSSDGSVSVPDLKSICWASVWNDSCSITATGLNKYLPFLVPCLTSPGCCKRRLWAPFHQYAGYWRPASVDIPNF